MKAIQVSQFGGPQVLQLCELDRPIVTSGQALIEVELAGVNFIDIYHRLGKYPVKTPYIPGVEGVGIIVELGLDAPNDLKVGDRVGWVMAISGYAEYVVRPAETLIPIPDAMSSEDAVSLLLQGMTTHYLARDSFEIKPGDTAVVHSAAGGVGLLLTQYIKSLTLIIICMKITIIIMIDLIVIIIIVLTININIIIDFIIITHISYNY